METRYILDKEEFREFAKSSAYCEVVLDMELRRQKGIPQGEQNRGRSITAAQGALIDEMALGQLLKLLDVLAENKEKLPDRSLMKKVFEKIQIEFKLVSEPS
jgi:hypothetical protein